MTEKVEAVVPANTKKIEGPVRLEIDFPNVEAMAEWFETTKGNVLPEDIALFHRDGLDRAITEHNTFVVKRKGDRPEEFRLRLKRTTIEEV